MSLHLEQIDHINFINWFKYQFPELSDDIHHFANERKCSPQQGVILKRMGVTPGVYDVFLAFPQDHYHGFWLELKANSKPSEAQKAFGERKTKRGYCCAIAHGLDAAKELTIAYLYNYLAERRQNGLKNGIKN